MLNPETPDIIDLGLRYYRKNLSMSLTYIDINLIRLTFIAPCSASGGLFVRWKNGNYLNEVELNLTVLKAGLSTLRLTENCQVYASIPIKQATYVDSSISYLCTPQKLSFPAGNTVFGSPQKYWQWYQLTEQRIAFCRSVN